MNYRMNVIRAVSVLLLSSVALLAQSDPVTSAVAVLTPPVDVSALPDRAIFAGGGIQAGQPSGWVNVVTRISGPVYAAFAQDIVAGKTSTRAGIESVVFHRGLLTVALKGNAGVATTGSATGGSYGVGGTVLAALDKVKLPGYYGLFSATWDYSNIADVGRQIASGQYQQAFSGATWRFGIGRRF